MTNEMPTCFFLLKAFLLNSGITFCSNFDCCISGNSELHSNQLPRWRLSCFPHLANRTSKKTWQNHHDRDPSSCLFRICVCIFIFAVHTPWKFNSSPLKIDGWKMSFLLGRPIFRGYVKLRGGIYIYMLFSYIVDSIWTFIPCQRRFLADNRYPICNDPIYGKACVSNRQVRRSWSHVFWIVGSVDSPCGHSQVSLDEFVKMMYRWPPVLVVQRFFFMDLFVMCQIVVTGCCENMWDVIRTCMFWSNGIYQEREEFECLLV